MELLSARAVEFDHVTLIRELLFAVADQLSWQLGYRAGRTLDVLAIQSSWPNYLPAWINYVPRTTSKSKMETLFTDGYLDLVC